MSAPVENKVKAGAVGAGAGGVAATFVLWVLGVVAFGQPVDAAAANDAVAAVPFPITGVVYGLLPLVGSYWAGYRAKHTPRPAAGEHVAP